MREWRSSRLDNVFFTLEGGKSLRRLATKSEGDLSGSGLAEFIAGINGADIVS